MLLPGDVVIPKHKSVTSLWVEDPANLDRSQGFHVPVLGETDRMLVIQHCEGGYSLVMLRGNIGYVCTDLVEIVP